MRDQKRGQSLQIHNSKSQSNSSQKEASLLKIEIREQDLINKYQQDGNTTKSQVVNQKLTGKENIDYSNIQHSNICLRNSGGPTNDQKQLPQSLVQSKRHLASSQSEVFSKSSLQHTKNKHSISNFDKLETLKMDFFEARTSLQSCLQTTNASMMSQNTSKSLTIDQHIWERQLTKMYDGIQQIVSIGNQWESLCEGLIEKLHSQRDKSVTMQSKIKNLKRETHLSRKREQSNQKKLTQTAQCFERSICDIQNIYERSQRLFNADYSQLEEIAGDMKQKRAKLSIKHLGHLQNVENEILEGDDYVSISGRLNYTQSALLPMPSKQNSGLSQMEQTDKYVVKINTDPTHNEETKIMADQKPALTNQMIEDNENPNLYLAAGLSENEKANNNQGYMEKTTPRTGRSSLHQQQNIQPLKPKLISIVPRLPLPNQQSHNKLPSSNRRKQPPVEIYSSVESSSVKGTGYKEMSSYQNRSDKQQQEQQQQEQNQNNESIYVPAMMLNDKGTCAEWDSMLEDDTKSNIDAADLSFYQRDFAQKALEITNPNEKILFQQIYALQHNINSNNLQLAKPKKADKNYECTTPRGPTQNKNQKSSNDPSLIVGVATDIDNAKTIRNQALGSGQPPLMNKLATKHQNLSKQPSSKLLAVERQQSSQKKSQRSDVQLQDLMDVTNAIITESPLPPLSQGGTSRRDKRRESEQVVGQFNLHQAAYLNQDVRLEDLINASALSLSMLTATDCGNFCNGEDNSFFKSNEKGAKLQPVRQKPSNINESYYLTQDEQSMIKEATNNEEEDDDCLSQQYTLNTNKNMAAINIIDYHSNDNYISQDQYQNRQFQQLNEDHESSRSQDLLQEEEESSSAYSKSQQNIDFKNTQSSIRELDDYMQSSGLISEEEDRQNIAQSFKSTAMMAAANPQQVAFLKQQTGSQSNYNAPTPGFSQRRTKAEDMQLQENGTSNINNSRRQQEIDYSKYLEQNHHSLIEKMSEYKTQTETSTKKKHHHHHQQPSLYQSNLKQPMVIVKQNFNINNYSTVEPARAKSAIKCQNEQSERIIKILQSSDSKKPSLKMKINIQRQSNSSCSNISQNKSMEQRKFLRIPVKQIITVSNPTTTKQKEIIQSKSDLGL